MFDLQKFVEETAHVDTPLNNINNFNNFLYFKSYGNGTKEIQVSFDIASDYTDHIEVGKDFNGDGVSSINVEYDITNSTFYEGANKYYLSGTITLTISCLNQNGYDTHVLSFNGNPLTVAVRIYEMAVDTEAASRFVIKDGGSATALLTCTNVNSLTAVSSNSEVAVVSVGNVSNGSATLSINCNCVEGIADITVEGTYQIPSDSYDQYYAAGSYSRSFIVNSVVLPDYGFISRADKATLDYLYNNAVVSFQADSSNTSLMSAAGNVVAVIPVKMSGENVTIIQEEPLSSNAISITLNTTPIDVKQTESEQVTYSLYINDDRLTESDVTVTLIGTPVNDGWATLNTATKTITLSPTTAVSVGAYSLNVKATATYNEQSITVSALLDISVITASSLNPKVE